MRFEERLGDRDAWSIGDGCSAARVLDLLSTKTVFLVVRECFYGTTRFDDFVARTGTSAPAVSRALKQLKAAGVVASALYREPGSRAREEYRLTEAGQDLLPVFLSLMQWGDTYLQEGRPPLSFVEAGTGRPVRVRVTADAAPETPCDDIEIRLNPAVAARLAASGAGTGERRDPEEPAGGRP
ncbi:putative HTH-type transcriptional regulator YybR [Nonomuraea coxensis DSM 45129]|uniref:HTH-type transcriptional regulator YybR n=2 Tax=Nonomuraea coxensis TaxID=404386 RepID=A0ABX8TSG2_9ACTN|nr:putative HTH-type transcriptional regulator YybR [Nonomuraea coxensis DSM 45129]